MKIDWQKVHEIIRGSAESLCRAFFPNGRKNGHEWCIGNLAGEPGDSLKIELEGERAGLFIDWATHESGTFLDALCGRGLDLVSAAQEISRSTGISIEEGNNGQNPASQYQQRPVFDWDRDFTPGTKQLEELAAWRGYSLKFCQWSADEHLIGRTGAHWAFPICHRGQIVAAHVRIDKNKWQFRPSLKSLGLELSPFVIGELAGAEKIFAGESQWDLFAILDKLGVHEGELVAAIATRGAANAGLLARVQSGAELYAVGQNDEAGRKWLEDLKGIRPFKLIPVPAAFHDAGEWLKNPTGVDEFVAALLSARRYTDFPRLVTGNEIARNQLPLPAVIIKGLLSRGEKFQLSGGSKSSKSWALIDLGICVASGLPWWGFDTVLTAVIYLNLEIPRSFFEARVREVCFGHSIGIPERFNVWHLRGARLYDSQRWAVFTTALVEEAKVLPNPLLLVDPIYKLMGRGSELHTGDVQTVLDQLEQIVDLVDGANASSHHYSKGNQAGKEAIDRASGSGVFQRDPDTLFPITPLATPDCFSIEPYLRNHEPIKPFGIRWDYPLFTRDDSLDPADLRMPRNGQSRRSSYIYPEQALTFIGPFEEIPRRELIERLIAPAKNGRALCKERRAQEIVALLIETKQLLQNPENKKMIRKA